MSQVFPHGTVRARPPEETWRALEPELPLLGITRVARLTGLDHLGIPVWTAIRPNSHTLVTSQGKGADDTLARISAVMEGAELWLVEQPLPVAARVSHHRLRPPYPMSALPVKTRHEGLPQLPLDWTEGRGLISGAKIPVPADLARRRAEHTPGTFDVFHVTSNGLATGNTRDEALLHALYELIERDTLHRDHLGGGAMRELVDPATVTDAYCSGLIARFLDAAMFLEIALVRNAYGIPVCAAYIWAEDYPVVFAGSGCHRDPGIALSRALTEAAQSRLTCIAGTRDDLGSHENAFASAPSRPDPVGPYSGDWTPLTEACDATFGEFATEVAAVSERVAAVTGYEPIAVDLPWRSSFAGVKVVGPGLEMRMTRSVPRPGVRRG
ncbi:MULTISPECIES: YcaO-like family protein [Streptomyces]|uniref:Uncharacterized protein n=1 Tax=Streptomyces tsukubensis (strain DSM 42081 / NBRC 108919 / NRRL 18488 / 9993) TaxID=1114943 RepID=I2N3Z2_STRT9|nr:MULTISPECIES: YcaO-like family protein [Streptomyces]AZK95814.1 hypothetical protein B7R87_19585 [Streptomyces tsukubensis]EIF91739.1 hypothetical protein [Streptomyces tsukubensis NRRL18488]MYS65607.1 hypothetical protein [Streptomyces sp. SID5473]QKM68161.1 hypothetical protein STSU_014195 [Streptomyces tsukubensis NRRL18488]TAI44562.1 hypothetical protein EWI31_13985 [Streptomyces tsukubensis]